MAKPTENIGKGITANSTLIPGNSGADFDLPAYRTNNSFVSCWKLSLKERLLALVRGRVWLDVMGHSHPPVWVGVECPLEANDKEAQS